MVQASLSQRVQVLHSPIYAGAYAFGPTGNRTRVVDGQARKASSHHRAIEGWNVLIKDSHEGYIDWRAYDENSRMLEETAHMQKRTARKSGRCCQAWPAARVVAG
ncbi:recombinase family protein [Rhodobacteraceae bacterium HSP-20]|uniref:Recombinase family protein n=1 Tax=Paragemmobacter amnigenus TaxID=2852097 RepID=A0ABS6J621_9RHOB|nr:recombinase family protein [Rhodobacter amnigenus]MBU9698972.1 recombinase family protein [Rhodobacter amnigenus]MBV4390199.1 recombinase family protein [Rhodobacter amnigenus]